MTEIWKPIKDYDNYFINNVGEIYNIKTGKMIKTPIFNNRYRFATLWKKGKSKKIKLARLVAETFIPNPNKLPCINHKDENKLNDIIDNLEWCTYSYNINYGTANKKRAKALGKKVNKIDINTNIIITTYNSISEAARDNKKCNISSISNCCKHKYGFKSCGGFKWEYNKVGDKNGRS